MTAFLLTNYRLRLAMGCLLAFPCLVAGQDSFGQPTGATQNGGGTRPAGPRGPVEQAAPSGLEAELVRMEPLERRDMKVPPTAVLHSGAMHGPTPTSIPGGRLVTTREIYEMVRRTRGDRSSAPRSFDILGGQERLPGALAAVPAGQAGSFDDPTQREFGQFLQDVTQGRKDLPMIFYCASYECWLSYNASLRAIKLGYTNVLWYRGGLEAWKHARLPMDTPDGGQGPGAGPQR